MSFTLEINATLNVQNVFSFSVAGGIEINNNGVAAVLAMQYSRGFSLPSNLSFNRTASFLLEVNTFSSSAPPVTIAGITPPAGQASIQASGDLTFLGGVVDLSGTFGITVSSTSLTVAVNANLTILGATFTASGFAGIYYGPNPGLVLNIALAIPGGYAGIAPIAALGSNFVISGSFDLQLNTSTKAEPDQNGTLINPGFEISVTNLGVYFFGFNATGSVSFGITTAPGVSFNVNINLDFFGLATINLTGFCQSRRRFQLHRHRIIPTRQSQLRLRREHLDHCPGSER